MINDELGYPTITRITYNNNNNMIYSTVINYEIETCITKQRHILALLQGVLALYVYLSQKKILEL